MNQYLVQIRIPERYADDRLQQLKDAVSVVVEKIRNEILPVHGGRVIRDCSGFGVKGHTDENYIDPVVETGPEGACAIRALDGVKNCGNVQFAMLVESAVKANKARAFRP